MSDNLLKAITELKNGYTCALCRDDDIITTTQRGVKPLLDWIKLKTDLKGFSAADKVVGKAAAFLYILLGISEIYALVISEAACGVFDRFGIPFKYEKRVEYIINRDGSGKCPMEQAVWEINSPEEALEIVKKESAELFK